MDYHFLNNVADVRSHIEYEKGHLPGAYLLPMFSNEERSLVGTCYKQEGKKEAVALGLEFFAKRLTDYLNAHPPTYLYCARGGMRSTTMSKLLSIIHEPITILQGGYKRYRHWVLKQFSLPYKLKVLCGLTGSGKTEQLHKMSNQIIDLEEIANHCGSSFGGLGKSLQPTQEHFENKLAFALAKCDPNKIIWVEDESRLIGNCLIPRDFFNQMTQAPVSWLHTPINQRLERLVRNYGLFPKEDLIAATLRIKKRLGSERCQEAIVALESDNCLKAFEIILKYYDKAYTNSHYDLRSFRK